MNPWWEIICSIVFSALVQLLIGVAFVSMMKQQLIDLVGWVKALASDVKDLIRGQKDLEGRVSHVEGRLGIPRGGE